MRLIFQFARSYPWQSAIMLLALLLAGIIEGISLTALLPFFSTALSTHSDQAEFAGEEDHQNQFFGTDLVDNIFSTLSITPTINSLLVFIVIGILFKNIILLMINRYVGYTVASIATDLRLKLLRSLLLAKWGFYLSQPSGNIVNAISSEAVRVATAYLHGANLITIIIQVIVYSFVAIAVSSLVALSSLIVGILLLFSLNYFVRKTKNAGQKQTSIMKHLISRLSDNLQSVKPLKSMGREHLADSVLTESTKKLHRALQREVFNKEALRSLQEPIFAIMIATGTFITLNYIGLPLATVMVLILVLVKLLKNLGNIQKQYQKMVACESAYWSLNETIHFAQQAQETLSGNTVPSLNTSIELQNIEFKYSKDTILKNINATIFTHQLTVISGPSGAGKTTLVDLVVGLLKPSHGTVLIDGVPLDDIDILRWRRMIGYVPQDNTLLHESVYYNVTLHDPALNKDDAILALKAADAYSFVKALPNGIETSVGERGNKLSGGQRQRILLARALVNHPKLLILDEATSALDQANEQKICLTLKKLLNDITILSISHRPAMMEIADYLYEVKNKKIDVKKKF